MAMHRFQPFAFRFQAFTAACVILVAGCNDKPAIRTYETEPTDRAQAASDATAEQDTNAPDATRAAMIPREQVYWFFKLTGPNETVNELRGVFDDLVKSVAFEGAIPKWKTPDGWSREEGNEFRLATLRPKENGDDVEISISMLPRRNLALGDAVSSNVNRWRTQLQLPRVEPAEIADAMERIPLADGEAMVFQFAGERSSEGPPMAARGAGGLPANHPPVTPERTAEPAPEDPAPEEPAPKDDAPMETASNDDKSNTTRPAAPIRFSPPEEWREGPSNSFRYASFVAPNGDRRAEVRISKFPADAGPQMTSLSANLNRWRRELGLPAVEGEQAAEEAFESMEVGGAPAKFIAIESETDAEDAPATQVAMVTHGDMLWFFKLVGDKETVEKESERFKAFLETVEFGGE